MNIKRNLTFCFTAICVLPFLVSHAQGANTKCTPCEDIQHAARLIAIEKRLVEVDNDVLLELDDKARCWYAKFQKGGFFYNGWQQISEDVVAKVAAGEKLKTRIIVSIIFLRYF